MIIRSQHNMKITKCFNCKESKEKSNQDKNVKWNLRTIKKSKKSRLIMKEKELLSRIIHLVLSLKLISKINNIQEISWVHRDKIIVKTFILLYQSKMIEFLRISTKNQIIRIKKKQFTSKKLMILK